MIEDVELLRRYAEDRSQEAFAELVRRRIGLVYAVAWRHTHDGPSAEDAAQAVFVDLARKAAALARRPVLVGWLHRSAQFAARDLMRANRRRQRREQEAHTMQQLAQESPDPEWDKLRPLLDEALNHLGARDRDAVLLRFIDEQPFAAIGAQLRLTENAARMRVERALEKLRSRLERRGLKSTTAALGAALTGQIATAAPAGLAAMVSGAALASGGASAFTASLLTIMSANKIMSVAVGAAALAIVGFGVYQNKQARAAASALAAANQEAYNLQTHLRSLQAGAAGPKGPGFNPNNPPLAASSAPPSVPPMPAADVTKLDAVKAKLAHLGNPHSSRLGEIPGLDPDTVSAVRAWLEQDPQAALQWLSSIPSAGNQQMHTTEAMIAIETSSDPQLAFELANSISLPSSRLARIGDVLQAWAPLDPAAAASAVQTADIPDAARTYLLKRISELKTPTPP